MKITAKQYKKIETRRRSLSKKDIERLDQGLDPIPLEDHEGEMLATYIRFRTKIRTSDLAFDPNDSPGVVLSTHVGNETGQRGTKNIIAMMRRKKKQGLNKGFPDYVITLRTLEGSLKTIMIELKRLEGSRRTPEQKKWIKFLHLSGVESSFANGANEAIEILEKFIGKI